MTIGICRRSPTAPEPRLLRSTDRLFSFCIVLIMEVPSMFVPGYRCSSRPEHSRAPDMAQGRSERLAVGRWVVVWKGWAVVFRVKSVSTSWHDQPGRANRIPRLASRVCPLLEGGLGAKKSGLTPLDAGLGSVTSPLRGSAAPRAFPPKHAPATNGV